MVVHVLVVHLVLVHLVVLDLLLVVHMQAHNVEQVVLHAGHHPDDTV
jgi:hypothetical protein